MECLVYNSVNDLGIKKKEIEKAIDFLFQKIKKDGQVSIHLVGEKRIKKLNLIYRGKDKVTDVLSFAVQENEFKIKDQDWGDMFICVSQVKRQAKKYNVDFREEMIRMMFHGALHLVGYDHMKKEDSKKMFELQEKLLVDFLRLY